MTKLVQHSSGRDNWRTPTEILDSVVECLGQIDLDPASDYEANFFIGANRIYTKEENSFAQEWRASTVFLNPPGSKLKGKSVAGLFWEKLVKHWERGEVEEAIFLGFSIDVLRTTQNYGKTPCLAFPFCVPQKRLRFWHPEEERDAPPMGNVIVYLPRKDEEHPLKRFCDSFSRHGYIVIHNKV